MPLVALPSGALAPLETPGLISLLSGGGGALDLARATLAHAEVDAGDLTSEDVHAVALWGLRSFCGTGEAVTLAAVCEGFKELPSSRLRVGEPTLAWVLDQGCLLALRAARRAAAEEAEDEPREGAHVFSVPDPWTGDDDD
jgi:hypothetical protein